MGVAIAGAGVGCRAAQVRDEPSSESSDERSRLDELFADLSDQRSTGISISSTERAARRRRLGTILADQGWDAILMEAGATMSYLADVSWGRSERLFGLLVLANGEHFWICPSFEAEGAKLRIDAEDGPGGEIVTWDEHEHPFAPLASALRAHGAGRLAIEPSLRHRFAHGMSLELEAGQVGIGIDVVVELRGRKDEHELALLRRANELTQEALVATSSRIEAGMTGRDIGALVGHAQRRLGLTGVWNLSLIGPAAAYPHGGERAEPIERGDVILIDTGGSFHGYQSDNTRSWVFDAPPSARVEEVWNVVRDAQRAAYETIRPGAACGQVDRAARDLIDARGFGIGYEHFTHRLGHGIGMEGHEDPYFDGGSRVLMKPGMTFSNEPGIYLYGEFGVRLEDIVVVTADGADHFGTWQKSPRSPA